MNTDIEFVQKFNLAYNAMCKPLCQQLKLSLIHISPEEAHFSLYMGNSPSSRCPIPKGI